jgi:hypothetical protein
MFAGCVDLDRFPGDTLDIRPELRPTWCVNAETCEGVPLAEYDFVLCDPPYSASDAERYGTSMVLNSNVEDFGLAICLQVYSWYTTRAGLPVSLAILPLHLVRGKAFRLAPQRPTQQAPAWPHNRLRARR